MTSRSGRFLLLAYREAIAIPDVISALRARLGDDRVYTDPETLAGRALDTWPLRLVQRVVGGQPASPRAVCCPRSTAEVSAALACLYEHNVAAVPFGGGSGVCGGAQPPPLSVVVDLGKLDQILSLDEENLTVTAQSGVVLERLEKWLSEHGYISGHYPQSIGLAQLGGLVATRSAGQFSTRYGGIEELLLGLEAVLPDGEVVRVGRTARWSSGPDLRQLWLGSEGAFGIITEVTLRIFPAPAERWLQAYALPDMTQGFAAIQGCLRPGWRPAVVRLHDASETGRSFPDLTPPGAALLLLLSQGPKGYAQAEGVALDCIVQAAGGLPLGPEPVQHWLEHRNDVRRFHQLIDMGILVDTIEVSAPWSAVAGLYTTVLERLCREVPELLAASGHSSHSYAQGTNLYFTLAAQPPRNEAAVARVHADLWWRVMEVTLAAGGSICHHHGIGKQRTLWLPAEQGTAHRLLQQLKAALDPKGLMNPGTLLP